MGFLYFSLLFHFHFKPDQSNEWQHRGQPSFNRALGWHILAYRLQRNICFISGEQSYSEKLLGVEGSGSKTIQIDGGGTQGVSRQNHNLLICDRRRENQVSTSKALVGSSYLHFVGSEQVYDS